MVWFGRLSRLVVFVLSAFGPAVTVAILSLGCGSDDMRAGDWWLRVGGYHFTGFVSVVSVLLGSLVLVLAFTWTVLRRDGAGAEAETMKNLVLRENLGTTRRVIVISTLLVLYTVLSVLYVNPLPSSAVLVEYGFGITCAGLGKTVSSKEVPICVTYSVNTDNTLPKIKILGFKRNSLFCLGATFRIFPRHGAFYGGILLCGVPLRSASGCAIHAIGDPGRYNVHPHPRGWGRVTKSLG